MGIITDQGYFTADGNYKTLKLRSDIDWMRVYNLTEADAANNGHGFEYYWQRGMTDGRGMYWYHPAGDQTVAIDQLAAGTGFYYINTVDEATPGAANTTITAISIATPPLVTLTSTTGLADGDVVRLSNITGAPQFAGIDFEINNLVTNTQFNLRWASTLAVAGTTATLRKIFYQRPIPDTPRPRYISAITQAASAVITLTVTHGYSVGMEVRFNVPAAFGMVEMNGLSGTVTAVNTANNTITVDIDSTGFTAFAFPAAAAVPFTPAEVIPYGTTLSTVETALVDTEYLGMRLQAGTASPAGSLNDVIFWQAGTTLTNTIG
jgi:hypothetical protein